MSFTPRTKDELARRTLGAFIARSPLSDTNEGSVLDTIAQSIGALASNTENRIATVRDAFDFRNASGVELDLRLAEFPHGTIVRKPAQRARGVVGIILQEGLTVDTVIPEGTTFSRTDNAVLYLTTEDVTISAGERIADLNVEASVLGSSGNAPSSVITGLEDVPNEIIAVVNTRAITTGLEEESDNSLKRRATLYLQSLARSQARALEYMALSADLPLRLLIANIYEDPFNRGMSYLYIEDGTGALSQNTSDGRIPSVTVPQGSLNVFYHDYPAIKEVIPAIFNNGTLTNLDPTQYVSIPERGIIYLDSSALTPGDTLTVRPYHIYTGSIATIQALIEGDPSNPEGSPGFRSAGTRVRVLSPNITRVSLSLEVQVQGGADYTTLETNITDALSSLINDLYVNAPLFHASIIDVVMDVEEVSNVHVFRFNTTDAFEDFYPPQGSVIRLNNLSISPVEV